MLRRQAAPLHPDVASGLLDPGQERLDPPSLQVELDAHEALAGARDGLLTVLSNYNIALSDVERRKGTLLEYNNIVIRGVDNESSQDPYQPYKP